MNDLPDEIAEALGRLQPGPTSARLDRRIQEALEVPAVTGFPEAAASCWFRVVRWAAAAMIIAAAAFLAVRWRSASSLESAVPATVRWDRSIAPTEPRDATASDFRRLGQANYLIDAEERGIVYTSARTPWRKVTWQYLSVSEWRDEGTKSTVQVVVPREETVVMPVTLH